MLRCSEIVWKGYILNQSLVGNGPAKILPLGPVAPGFWGSGSVFEHTRRAWLQRSTLMSSDWSDLHGEPKMTMDQFNEEEEMARAVNKECELCGTWVHIELEYLEEKGCIYCHEEDQMFDKYRTAKQALEIIEGVWFGFLLGGGLAAVTVAHKSWPGFAIIAVIAIVLTATMFHWRGVVKRMESEWD